MLILVCAKLRDTPSPASISTNVRIPGCSGAIIRTSVQPDKPRVGIVDIVKGTPVHIRKKKYDRIDVSSGVP